MIKGLTINKFHCSVLMFLLFTFCSTPQSVEDPKALQQITETEPDTTKYEPIPALESFANIQLRVELEEVYKSDQNIRNLFAEAEKKYSKDSKEIKALTKEWKMIDSINIIKVTSLLDKYGWMGSYDIGNEANTALWLVIQHSDLNTQKKYLPKVRRAVKENKAQASHLALLEDRILVREGKKQIYGSQLETDSVTGKYKLAPIEDESSVNKRRAQVGLEPLEMYAKRWEINYVLPKK